MIKIYNNNNKKDYAISIILNISREEYRPVYYFEGY